MLVYHIKCTKHTWKFDIITANIKVLSSNPTTLSQYPGFHFSFFFYALWTNCKIYFFFPHQDSTDNIQQCQTIYIQSWKCVWNQSNVKKINQTVFALSIKMYKAIFIQKKCCSKCFTKEKLPDIYDPLPLMVSPCADRVRSNIKRTLKKTVKWKLDRVQVRQRNAPHREPSAPSISSRSTPAAEALTQGV